MIALPNNEWLVETVDFVRELFEARGTGMNLRLEGTRGVWGRGKSFLADL